MRILYMPVISARNIESAPSYQFFKALHRHALAMDPTTVFYVMVPDLATNPRWRGGADWDLPRVHPIEIAMHEDQWEDLVLVTKDFFELFNERYGKYHFDLILTERPMIATLLQKLSAFHIKARSRTPLVVIRDQFTIDTKWWAVTHQNELLEAVGWSQCPTIFQSDHQAKRALQIAAQHLAPAHVRRMADSMTVFPLGIDCDDVDLINGAERDQKHEKITINYSHKIFFDQKYIESLQICDSVLAGGRPVQLQVVTGSSPRKFDMIRKAQKFRYMNIYGNQSRQEFLRRIARAHIFISNSVYEDFSATVAEQIYSGLIPVLIRKEWSEYLVGKDYPYLFDTPLEGNTVMRYVVDHYDEVYAEVVPGLQARMRELFDLGRIIPEMVEWLGALYRKNLGMIRFSADMREVCEKAYQTLPDTFGEEDFYRALQQQSRHLNVKRDGGTNSTPKWLVIDWILLNHPEVRDLGGVTRSWAK